MSDSVQEIKGKLSIEDLVASYVTLKKAGRYLKGLCPFHQEKTPSFYVSPERQLAYCFSCQKGGDHFQFIQDIEGLDFRGALEFLAEKANVDLPRFQAGPKVSKDQKERLRACNKDASKFFVQRLWKTEDGLKVLKYLENRGLTEETIREFEVGFAPDEGDVLYRHLLEKKHEKADILETNLAYAKDSTSNVVSDRFHLRLMFPIQDGQGAHIAFGGRALKKGDQPKYLNSSDYVLYKKGSVLYNLNRAKAKIREADLTVCVEGYFDVMASQQAGVANVVASSGTALTAEQFKLLKRYSERVALAFDQDDAGQEALLRAVLTAQPLGMDLLVIDVPEGKDAADTVKENPKLWVEAVSKAVPYLEYFFAKWRSRYDLESSSGKRDFTDACLSLLKGVLHPVERDHHLKVLSKWVGTPVDLLYDYLNQVKSRGRVATQERKENAVKKSTQERLFDYFLGLFLAYPAEFFEFWEDSKEYAVFEAKAQALTLVKPLHKLDESAFKAFYSDFENLDTTSVYKSAKDYYNLHAVLDEAFYGGLEQGDKLRKLAFEAEVKNVDKQLVRKEFEKVITLLYLEFTSLSPLNGSY